MSDCDYKYDNNGDIVKCVSFCAVSDMCKHHRTHFMTKHCSHSYPCKCEPIKEDETITFPKDLFEL
jgi:hypothetical protein